MHQYQKRSSSPNLAAKAYQKKIADEQAHRDAEERIEAPPEIDRDIVAKHHSMMMSKLMQMQAAQQQADGEATSTPAGATKTESEAQQVQAKGGWQQKADTNAIFSSGSALPPAVMAKYENLMPDGVGLDAGGQESVQLKYADCTASDSVQVPENELPQDTVSVREVQLAANGEKSSESKIQQVAAKGFSGSATSLPHLNQIQQSFEVDLSGVQAYVGGDAVAACQRMGAQAYASGNQIAFKEQPSLELAAHEAAHIVQQRSGKVQLAGGVGKVGDKYENHADAVAAKVSAGESAAPLLGDFSETNSEKRQSQGRLPTDQRSTSSHLAQAIANSSDNEALRLGNLGFSQHNNEGNYQEALKLFEESLKLYSSTSLGWYNRGVALLNLNQLKDALDSVQKALDINTNWHLVKPSEAWSLRGLILKRLGRLEEAIQSYQRALSLDPGYEPAQNNLTILEARSNNPSLRNQSAQPLTPLERFKERLRGTALRQLHENYDHIARVQYKYQNLKNPEALGRLRQVVEADERLKKTQDLLTIRQRTNPESWRDKDRAPVLKNPSERQALIDQNNAKLNEIKQVRYTLLQLYPASGVLRAKEAEKSNTDDQLLGTLNDRFENIRSNIQDAIKRIESGDIQPELLESVVAETLKETPEADRAAVNSYLQSERKKQNTFRFFGFLAQIALTVAAIFTGGFIGAVMGALATAMGIGQAAYEFEEADDLNIVAKTGQEAGGNQLLADPDAARFNYIMGWVNVALAGLEGGLAVREGTKLLVGARAAERLANQAGAQVLFRIPQEKLMRLQEAMRLEKAKDPGARQLLASLRSELGEDFLPAYNLFKNSGLEVLDDAEASRIWGGMARREGRWIRIIKGGKISEVKEGAEGAFYVTEEQYEVIKKLPRNQTQTREEIFQNLPPELRQQGSATKTSRIIVERKIRVRSDYLEEYENVSLGERMGRGGNKDVYHIKGKDDLAIGILRKGGMEEIDQEIKQLQQLEAEGLQTIEVLGTTNHNGRPAIIMKKYAQGSKDIVQSIDANPQRNYRADISLLNQNSINDLEQIRAILQRKKIYIQDLQFLIAEDGHIYITDPIGIIYKPSIDEMNRNAMMIDLLIKAAQENI